MIYNVAFDPNLMKYADTYETSLHFSPHFQEYAEWLARRLLERFHLNDKTIIEIGCGKGEFLSLLCREGRNRGIGFDPSFDGNRDGHEPTNYITYIRDFYSEKYATDPADLICCRQVLEHLDSPRDFLGNINRTIGKQGDTTVFFEVPNGLYTFRDMGIWDIIYEHVCYFTPASLSYLIETSSFSVKVMEDAFEGQFLCAEAVPEEDGAGKAPERPSGLDRLQQSVEEFPARHAEKMSRLARRIRERAGERGEVVIWGAGSKGVTFLNLLMDVADIRHAVDVNPHKEGKYIPGTGQEVVTPSALRRIAPDLVLVMNPIYENEIREAVSGLGLKAELLCV